MPVFYEIHDLLIHIDDGNGKTIFEIAYSHKLILAANHVLERQEYQHVYLFPSARDIRNCYPVSTKNSLLLLKDWVKRIGEN